jgi:hypothetical protein
MIMMPYAWILDIAAAHRSGRLLAPHRRPRRKGGMVPPVPLAGRKIRRAGDAG